MFFEEMDLHAIDQGCAAREVLCGLRCNKFVSRFFKFWVFFL